MSNAEDATGRCLRAALRKISLRAHSWFNWLYPMPF